MTLHFYDLSNVQLEYQDQKKEAAKVKARVDKSVESSERGAIQMEEVFKKNGHPAYNCSFVLRITADILIEHCLSLFGLICLIYEKP